MDGNFDQAPKHFSKLYVIREKINRSFTTAVYILLLQNKTLTTYEKMLTTLLKKCDEQHNLFPYPVIVYMFILNVQ